MIGMISNTVNNIPFITDIDMSIDIVYYLLSIVSCLRPNSFPLTGAFLRDMSSMRGVSAIRKNLLHLTPVAKWVRGLH